MIDSRHIQGGHGILYMWGLYSGLYSSLYVGSMLVGLSSTRNLDYGSYQFLVGSEPTRGIQNGGPVGGHD